MWKKAGEWRQRTAAGAAGWRQRNQGEKESTAWIPFASYCTTGQFGSLQQGFQRHCGPTAAVNVIRTLENLALSGRSDRAVKTVKPGKQETTDMAGEPERSGKAKAGMTSGGYAGSGPLPAASAAAQRRAARAHEQELFLQCAQIGRREHIYWNSDILGRFGGTSNFLTGIFLRSCLRAAGCADDVSVRFHPWITARDVRRALDSGAIVYLQVYFHPKYKNHHMLCYAYETNPENGEPSFLLADGWQAGPVRVDAAGLGHGHFFTIRKKT